MTIRWWTALAAEGPALFARTWCTNDSWAAVDPG